MATKVIDPMITWGNVGTSDGVELSLGDVIVHKSFDPGTVFVNFAKIYTNLKLIPIAPGTELYTTVGANCSYVSEI